MDGVRSGEFSCLSQTLTSTSFCSCVWWLWRAAHFSHCVETATAQTTRQTSSLDTPHSQPLFGSFRHGNCFGWSPPLPGGLRLCPHSATVSMPAGSRFSVHIFIAYSVCGPNPRFVSAEGVSFPHPCHLRLCSVRNIPHSLTVAPPCFHSHPEIRSGQSPSSLYPLLSLGFLWVSDKLFCLWLGV